MKAASKRRDNGLGTRLGSQLGFSLVELMVVGAILGVASLIAAPNFLEWKSRSELRQAVTEVANHLYEARVFARSQNAPVTVTIDLSGQAVRSTITNSATGTLLRTTLSSQLPHVVSLMVGPSSGWATAATATVSFTSVGTRAGGPGPTLNQELAFVNNKGLQYALKVTPRGVATWCPQSACL
jgi:prepilin-type N-terminal cleavage/methylation domain-containing protein